MLLTFSQAAITAPHIAVNAPHIAVNVHLSLFCVCRCFHTTGEPPLVAVSNAADLHDKMEDQYTTVSNTADLRMTK